jgi:GTP-binding protein
VSIRGGTLVRPVVAIVGRPNVGKSTLFNRLVGRRQSLVRDVPGVTRDRLYGPVTFERWQATAVDTGGFDPLSSEPLIEAVRRQVDAAIAEADIVLFVVDARAGATALDVEIAALLRRADRPVVLVANKVESDAQMAAVAELFRLGMGEPVPVSAEHGRGVAELLEIVRARAPEGAPTPPPAPATSETARGASRGPNPVHIAIIGRPNAGKSSLVNTMVGGERVLVHDAPGTTRDAVDTAIEVDGRPYVLVDTAGIRRKGRVSEALEKLSVVMALKSLERCQVALVVVDASEGLAAQDAHIAGYAHDAGRASIVVVNKWDLVPPGMVRKAEVIEQIRERLPFLDYAPICFTSALRGEGLADLFRTIDEVARAARRRVSAAEATAVIREAIERRPITIRGAALTLQAAAQVSVEPPTFALRVNRPDEIHFSYERYLVKSLRRVFDFTGSPVRLSLRKASGPRARGARR